MLALRSTRTGTSSIEVTGVAWQTCRLVPDKSTSVQFGFTSSSEGWQATHDLRLFSVTDGCLITEATGGDPYMVRSHCEIDGEQVKKIRVRMAVSAGTGAQFFWTSVDSPTMAEDKALNVAIQADSEFHEYVFPVSQHVKWRGQTITSIRLDPMSGADQAAVKIDFIRGE